MIGWGLQQLPFIAFLGWVPLGVLQWLVLQNVIAQAGWWVIATTVAMPLANLIRAMAGDPAPHSGVTSLVVFIRILVPGCILGAAQWMVLRNKVPRAGWWVLVTAVGMAPYHAAVFLGYEWEWIYNFPFEYWLGLTAAILAFAIVTAEVLVRRLQLAGQWSESK